MTLMAFLACKQSNNLQGSFRNKYLVGAFVNILSTNLVQWLLVSRMTPQLPGPWLKWLALPPSAVAKTDLLGLDAARDKTAPREKEIRL